MLEENKQAIGKNPFLYGVVISEDVQDDDWDAFVELDAQEQFEQTSRWAQLNYYCLKAVVV